MINLELTKDQKRLVDRTREFVQAEIIPIALDLDSKGDTAFDKSVLEILSKQNLICPSIPQEYGGLGLNQVSTTLVIEEIAAGCSGVASIVNANLHAASPILLAGSKQQKEDFLPILTSQPPRVAAFALTEAGAGSDVASITSIAAARDNDYLISGTKDYVLNASIASFFSVFVTSPPINKRSSLRLFILPSSTEGVSIGRVRNKSGLRCANTSEVILNDVRVTAESMVGGDRAGSGYLLLTQILDRGRVLVAAVAVGLARSAYNLALKHARSRVQFGKPIIHNQAVSFALAEMATKIELARLITWKASWLIDQDQDYTTASSMAKLYASEIAQQIAIRTAEILGAEGYLANTFADKYVRDARVLSTIEGTNEIQKAIIASLM